MPLPVRLGRPRTTNLRDMVDAPLYMADTGCQWRMLPKDFPPVSSAQGYFYKWRDGAPAVLKSIRSAFPWLRHVFADGGYAGPRLEGALAEIGAWTLEIVKRSDKAEGFVVLPRRWVVERTLAWLGRCRRLAKDWETTIASATAWLLIAHIRLATRRLARL